MKSCFKSIFCVPLINQNKWKEVMDFSNEYNAVVKLSQALSPTSSFNFWQTFVVLPFNHEFISLFNQRFTSKDVQVFIFNNKSDKLIKRLIVTLHQCADVFYLLFHIVTESMEYIPHKILSGPWWWRYSKVWNTFVVFINLISVVWVSILLWKFHGKKDSLRAYSSLVLLP